MCYNWVLLQNYHKVHQEGKQGKLQAAQVALRRKRRLSPRSQTGRQGYMHHMRALLAQLKNSRVSLSIHRGLPPSWGPQHAPVPDYQVLMDDVTPPPQLDGISLPRQWDCAILVYV